MFHTFFYICILMKNMNIIKIDLFKYRTENNKIVSLFLKNITKSDYNFYDNLNKYINTYYLLVDLDSKVVIAFKNQNYDDFIFEDYFKNSKYYTIDLVYDSKFYIAEKRCYQKNGDIIWVYKPDIGYTIDWDSFISYGSRKYKINQLLKV